MLLNPKKETFGYLDERSREIMLKTVEFFENKGKTKLKKDEHERVWYADFLEFVKENKIFATMLTPAAYGSGDSNIRWDMAKLCICPERYL